MRAASLLRPLLACLLVTTSLAFVLRKRSWDRSENSRLQDALDVIQQERRRLAEESDPYADMFEEAIEESLDDRERALIRKEAEEELLSGIFNDAAEEVSLPVFDNSDILESQAKRSGVSSLLTEPVNKGELESILEPSDDEKIKRSKKTVPFALGGPGTETKKREYDPSDSIILDEKRSEDERESLSEDEINELLDAAENTELDVLDTSPENDQEKGTVEPVSEGELEDVLKSDDDSNNEEESEDEEQEEEVGEENDLITDDDIDREDEILEDENEWLPFPAAEEAAVNKEWLLNQYLKDLPENGYPTTKKKRSFQNIQQEISDELAALDEVDEEGDQAALARNYIKTFLELEDEENTNLANALNLATLGQVEQSNSYIAPEADFIQKAIANEEAIQTLKDALRLGDRGDQNAMAKRMERPQIDLYFPEERDAHRKRSKWPEPPRPDIDLYFPEERELVRKRGDPGFGAEEFGEAVDDDDDEDPLADITPEEAEALAVIDAAREENGAVPFDEDEEDATALREMLIEKLRQFLESVDNEPSPSDNALEPAEEGEWLDRPLEEEEEWYLNPLLRDLYERYKAGELDKRAEPDGEVIPLEEEYNLDEDDLVNMPVAPLAVLDEPSVESEADELDNDITEEEVEDALRDYLVALEPWQRQALKDEIDKEIDELSDEMCPAIELMDDCAVARDLRLKLDEEATDLCNRHQLCYTCGAVHGVSRKQCNEGYLGDAYILCEGEDDPQQCQEDADGLLDLITLAHPRLPAASARNACRAECTLDYIYGLKKK